MVSYGQPTCGYDGAPKPPGIASFLWQNTLRGPKQPTCISVNERVVREKAVSMGLSVK